MLCNRENWAEIQGAPPIHFNSIRGIPVSNSGQDSIGSTQDDIRERLIADNIRISRAERERDYDWLTSVLADNFVFRRANGCVVDKECYLAQLVDPAASYAENEPDEATIEATIYEDSALVVLLVRAKGYRRTGDFQGTFRNVRIWQPVGNKWKCVGWFNTKVGS